MEMEKDMTPEEETSILTLTDENGEDIDFEYLDCLTYQDKEYLVLMPADEAETQIVILEVEPVDDENENYLAVDDEAVLDAMEELTGVLGILRRKTDEKDDAVEKLLAARAEARANKNWAESDRLRDEITKLGYVLKDTKQGQQITKAI